MIKLHPEYITKKGEKEFVVIPYSEYLSLQEYLQDVEDLLDMRKIKKADAKKAGVPLAQVKKDLGL